MYRRSQIIKKLSQIEKVINGEKPRSEKNKKVFTLLDEIRQASLITDSNGDEGLYKLIFEKAPIGILHYNEDGIISDCNSEFVDIIGSSREKLVGLHLKKLPNKELVDTVKFALNGEESIYEGRYEPVTSDKSIYVRAVFHPIESSGGIALVEDITKHYEAHEKLKESEMKFRSLFENKHIVFLLINPMNGQIVDANPAATNFYGWSLEELKEKRISEINTLSSEEVERKMQKAKNNENTCFHFKHKLADGTIADVEVYSGAIQVEDRILLFTIVNDIRERIGKDKELLKFKLGIERSSNVVFITDKNGVIEYVNKAFTDLYGYEKEDVIGKTPRVLKSGKHSDELYQHFWDTILQGKVIEGELINKTADGEYLTIKASANPIVNDSNDLLGFIAIQKDITAEKEADRKLKNIEVQLRDIIEHSTNMFYTHDVDGYLTYVSPQSKKYFGVDPAEALRNWTDFITNHPDNKKAIEYTAKAIQTGESQPPYRLQIKKIDGTERWVNINEAPIIKEGKVVGITGALSDITEQVEAQDESDKHRKLLDELTDKTSAAVWARDCNSRIIFANKEFERLFSVKGKELLDEKVYDVFSDEIATLFNGNDQKVLKQKKPISFEIWINVSGEDRYFRVNMFPLHNLPGIDISIGGIALDITDQKRNEEIIKASLQEKEVLLGEIHHRVKNNLAVISGLLELSMIKFDDDRLTSAIQSSQLRIQSMAKVHELLYESESFSQISFKYYIESLIETVYSTIEGERIKPNFITHIEPIPLNINHAIPCGLIVNELITNSIKHAFQTLNQVQSQSIFIEM